MITLNLKPETILFLLLVTAILLMFYFRFKPDKKQKQQKTRRTRSPKKVSQIEREIKRLEKMLKD
jgi:preprotein translocase subunit YajC